MSAIAKLPIMNVALRGAMTLQGFVVSRSLIVLLAVALTTTASGRAKADGLAVLPSHICQAPLAEEFDFSSPVAGAERWSHAFQAVMNRCQKGDVLLLTRDAQTNALRCL